MLAATVLRSIVVALDATIVGGAVPFIRSEFKVGIADLQWVSTGYMLTVAGLRLRLFRSRQFSGANLVTLVVHAALTGGRTVVACPCFNS